MRSCDSVPTCTIVQRNRLLFKPDSSAPEALKSLQGRFTSVTTAGTGFTESSGQLSVCLRGCSHMCVHVGRACQGQRRMSGVLITLCLSPLRQGPLTKHGDRLAASKPQRSSCLHLPTMLGLQVCVCAHTQVFM